VLEGRALEALDQRLGLFVAGFVEADAGGPAGEFAGAGEFVFAVADEEEDRHCGRVYHGWWAWSVECRA
jgi:hypothetical protein